MVPGLNMPSPLSSSSDSHNQTSTLASSVSATQSRPEKPFGNQLHLDTGMTLSPPRTGNGALPNTSSPITPADSTHPCDVSISDGRSPRSSVFASSAAGDDGPSPRSVTSLPLPERPHPVLHRWIRRFSNSSPYHNPTSLNLSHEDPLWWVLAARESRSRESDITDLELQQEPLEYMIHHVPKVMHDEQKRSGLRVTVEIARVIHGTWYGRPAVYVSLTAWHHKRKVPQTNIKIEVAAGGLGDVSPEVYSRDQSAHQPFIVKFAPKKHYGSPIPVDQSTEVGVEGKLAPMSPVGGMGGLNASLGRTTNVVLERRQMISSTTSTEGRGRSKTVFTLDAIENDVTKDGVYDELPMGLIIETQDRPVVITVDVQPKQKVFDSTFRYVADKYFRNVPIFLDNNHWGLDGLPADLPKEMTEWSKEICEKLVTYSVDYETILFGE